VQVHTSVHSGINIGVDLDPETGSGGVTEMVSEP